MKIGEELKKIAAGVSIIFAGFLFSIITAVVFLPMIGYLTDRPAVIEMFIKITALLFVIGSGVVYWRYLHSSSHKENSKSE